MRPTGKALQLAALGVALAVLPLVLPGAGFLWVLYWTGLVLALVLDGSRCPRPEDLDVTVDAPEQVFMGNEEAEMEVVLSLPTPRPVPAQVTVDWGELLEPAPVRSLVLSPELAGVTLPLVPRRRGEADLETLWVRWESPWGLVRRTATRPLERSVRAVPDVGFVRGAAVRFFDVRESHIGAKIERFAGEGSEFESLREWQPGLGRRSIDWKASARHTRLLSREMRAERNHQLILAMDTGRLMAEPVDGAPLLDHAIHAALILAYVSLRHGDRVGLFPFAARPGVLTPPRGGVATFRSLLALTGELAYEAEETNFTWALTELASRLRRRSLVVVFTDFVDHVTSRLMVDHLTRLGRRHVVVFAALRDPTLTTVRDAEPVTSQDVERAVMAETLVKEREVTLARLRREGVFALDAPPREVGPPLLDRYLDVKRRERI